MALIYRNNSLAKGHLSVCRISSEEIEASSDNKISSLLAASWVSTCSSFPFNRANLRFNVAITGSVDSSRAVSSMSDLSTALRIEVMVFSDLRRLLYA